MLRHAAAIERPPFEVTETGWGEFDIIIKIFFVGEAAEKPMTFTHHLKLHPWPTQVPTPLALLSAPVPAAEASISTAGTPEPPPAPPILLSPVHSWQYEEIIFAEPPETFYSLLLSRPPTPLPKSNRHPKNLQYALGGGGNMGEFTSDMEKEEGDRLEAARKKTLEEIEGLRKRLIGNEKDLTGSLRRLVTRYDLPLTLRSMPHRYSSTQRSRRPDTSCYHNDSDGRITSRCVHLLDRLWKIENQTMLYYRIPQSSGRNRSTNVARVHGSQTTQQSLS